MSSTDVSSSATSHMFDCDRGPHEWPLDRQVLVTPTISFAFKFYHKLKHRILASFTSQPPFQFLHGREAERSGACAWAVGWIWSLYNPTFCGLTTSAELVPHLKGVQRRRFALCQRQLLIVGLHVPPVHIPDALLAAPLSQQRAM